MRDYTRIANKYARDAVSGKIIACQWVIKACQRQLDDLERTKNWPYKFDPKKANRICAFAEGLPHIKGEWAKRGEKLVLQPWQIFIYTTIFGWIHKNTGNRRFRTAYNEVARKNGKSSLSAPIGIYMMCADGEAGSEVYSAATTRDQAKICWEAALNMVRREPGLRQAFGVDVSAHTIHQISSGSRFQALSADGNTLDGLNIHCAIIDELHAHPNRRVYDVVETACAARVQPLRWIITTAGSDQSGICYEQRSYVTKILDKIVDDPSYFGIIYTLDPEDDWQNEDNWKKSNPNLDVSVDRAELQRLAMKAAEMPSALNNFLTKHLDVWVSASVNLFNVTKWHELANPSLKPEQFKDDPCWLGLDFAPRNDFSSLCQLFRREEEDGLHFYAFWKHYLSEGKIEESENASYAGWARDGWIITNPGNQTNTDQIEDNIADIYAQGYQIQELDADPSRTQGIENHVEQRTSATIVEVPQNPSNLCPATEYLSALISDGKIHHNGDPATAWMLSNVIGVPKGNWSLYPGKDRPENKIDAVTALLIALSRAMVNEYTGSIYDKPGEPLWL